MSFISIRKGCLRCGVKLITFKEKVTRTCSSCARKALEGFDKMAAGKVKEGFKQVVEGKTPGEVEAIKSTVKEVLGSKRKKLIKALKKKGLTEEEITEGLDKFDKMGV